MSAVPARLDSPTSSSTWPASTVEAGPLGRSSAALLDSSLGASWFGDLGGVLDVALWGGVCVLIVLAVRLASRRLGHRYLWRAFGVPLFVVALFFFYENLGRVLPASV